MTKFTGPILPTPITPVAIADGADVAGGATTDAANITGIAGTASGKLRGMVQLLANLITALGSPLQAGGAVSVSNFPATQPVSAAALPLPTGAATSALQTSIANTAHADALGIASTIDGVLGSPFQAGGSIGNTAFGISGTLPAFASTPTFNFGTLNGAATAALHTTGNTALSTINTTLGTPMQATGGTVALIAGSAVIGHVILDNASLAVTGSFYQATQPVSLVSLPALAAGSNNIGHVTLDNASLAVTGSFYQATQPISAVSLPLPTLAATSTLQSTINTTLGSPFQAGGSIGNTSFGISGTLPAFAATPTFTVGNASLAVTGAFYQATQPISGSISFTAPQHVIIDSSASIAVTGPLTDAALRASAVPVSGTFWQSTQPISAASLPLPTLAATSTLQTSIGATDHADAAAINTTLGSPFQAGGSIGNSSFGISGTLPAFAATPTFNFGTLNGAATSSKQDSIITALGSPFQAGGSIANASFGISGTLPAFASTPTVNLDATDAASLAAIMQNTAVLDAGSLGGDSIVGALNTIAESLAAIDFRLRELPLNIAKALNQTLNGNIGPMLYASPDGLETFRFDSANTLNN